MYGGWAERTFRQDELEQLGDCLEKADPVIGEIQGETANLSWATDIYNHLKIATNLPF